MTGLTRTIGGLLLALVFVTSVDAQEFGGWYRRPRSTPPTPQHFMSNPPGSEFYPQYAAPGPVVAVPSYQWGYFGARSKSSAYDHYGIYGDRTTTVFPRGY